MTGRISVRFPRTDQQAGRQALAELANRIRLREAEADEDINLNGYGECASMDELRSAINDREDPHAH